MRMDWRGRGGVGVGNVAGNICMLEYEVSSGLEDMRRVGGLGVFVLRLLLGSLLQRRSSWRLRVRLIFFWSGLDWIRLLLCDVA